MGEPSNNNFNPSSVENQPIMCDTYAGLVHVEWDPHSPVTPIGKMVFLLSSLKRVVYITNGLMIVLYIF